MRLLLVEDDPELSRRLSGRLRSGGFAVDIASEVEQAKYWPDVSQLSAIILDLGLPDGEGTELLEYWRREGVTVPILILTARGSWQDKVEGLNAGADDFVVKPARFEELLARLHALIRRQTGRPGNGLSSGGLELDPSAKTVSRNGEPIELSRNEFRLLHLFMRRAGHILPQSEILENLYALDAEREQNTIEVHVSRLRRKIGKQTITTVRGFGYRFEK